MSSSRIILITGANSGVGYATAKVIASASPDFHIVIACRSLQNAETTVSELRATPGVLGTFSPILLDVTSEESIEAAALSVEQQFGKLDVLINNAGVASAHPDLKTRYKEVMETNVLGPMLVSGAFKPLLLKSKNPYSIYISSVAGSLTLAADPTSHTYRGPPKGEAYRASKAALNMAVLQEIATLGDAPLKIFLVCPGVVRSNLAGKGEKSRVRNSKAGDPEDSGRVVLGAIQGEREADIGSFIHMGGVHPW